MNAHRRHLQYKKSVYAKGRFRVILITALSVVLILALVFVIVGSLLLGKVQNNGEESSSPPTGDNSLPLRPTNGPALRGVPVYLVGNDGSPLSSLRSQISALDSESTALSVPLDREDGTLLYRSSVASALGYRGTLSGSRSLWELLELPKENDFYVSASLTLTECAEEDALIRSAKLAASASLVCEALQAGADDVLLFAPDATADQLDALISLADTVHTLQSNAVVGLILPEGILLDDGRDGAIERLSLAFNILALDLSDHGEELPHEYVSRQMGPDGYNLLVHLLRYEMRVIVPPTEEAETANLTSVLTAKSIYAWQVGYSS
ncbi:MAG: hypothetical protein IJY42_06355 [Clostridia bacterium]|nr:hypothetical protein [Clostridia bacterium]